MKKNETVGLLFLKKAQQDFAAATELSKNRNITDEIVGFHIQQTIEKSLKALLICKKVDFRKTHDIRELLDCAHDSLLIEQRALRRLRLRKKVDPLLFSSPLYFRIPFSVFPLFKRTMPTLIYDDFPHNPIDTNLLDFDKVHQSFELNF